MRKGNDLHWWLRAYAHEFGVANRWLASWFIPWRWFYRLHLEMRELRRDLLAEALR